MDPCPWIFYRFLPLHSSHARYIIFIGYKRDRQKLSSFSFYWELLFKRELKALHTELVANARKLSLYTLAYGNAFFLSVEP